MTTANRGKKAEKLLRSHMETLASASVVAAYRLPDAHAGSMVATLCDFLFMRKGQLFLVECKSTKHPYRLPHGNVDPAQVARMRVWKLAGAKALVMIYHETLDQWRVEEIDFFLDRSTGGSWDFRTRVTPGALSEVFDREVSSQTAHTCEV